jgi:Tfp pilus assembly protein PilW
MKLPRGIGFVETLITVACFAIVMVAITESVLFFYRANTSSIEQAYQIESARRGIDTMVRDLREATYADDGSYPLASIATSSVTFYADTDHDASIEKLRYTIIGTQLIRIVTEATGTPPTYTGGAATSTLSDYVRNTEQNVPLFRYYDVNGVEVTDFGNGIADVRSVSVNLIVNVVPIRAPGDFTLQSSATIRNLRAQ